MFCFCESNEKRLNSVRSKFADASISRLIEDRGRSEVQPSYRLSKVRETCAAFETLTWRKYEKSAEVESVFLFLFPTWLRQGKFQALHVLSKKPHAVFLHLQSSPTTRLTYDKTRFSKGAVNLKVLKALPHSSQIPKDQPIGHGNLFKNTS